MADTLPPKFFKRQSGQMKALDAELQETLEAMKVVVEKFKTDPPKLKEGGRYHMVNPPITEVPLPPNWVTNPVVPKAPAIPRPGKRLATPQPMPAPRAPMRTPPRPHRVKAESFPEIPVEVVLEDE